MTGARTLRQHGRTVQGWPHPIVSAIRDRAPFRAANLRGELAQGLGLPSSPGRLEGKTLDLWRDDWSVTDYVVWSYGTPIAWHASGGAWVVPDDRYSATTSRHQRFVHLAVMEGGVGDDCD